MALIRTKAANSVTWWIGVLLMAVSAWAFFTARSYGVAGFMPTVAAVAIFGLAALHTVGGLVFGTLANNDEWHSEEARRDYRRRLLGYLTIVLAVVLAGWVVGFKLALPAFVFLFVGLTTKRWVLGAILAAAIWVFTYYLLGEVLHTAFPPTLMSRWLVRGFF